MDDSVRSGLDSRADSELEMDSGPRDIEVRVEVWAGESRYRRSDAPCGLFIPGAKRTTRTFSQSGSGEGSIDT